MSVLILLSDNESLPTVMSVLFRPVDKTDSFGNYSIKAYDASRDRIEIMKEAPMNVVNGALVFFSNLSRELRIAIQKYTRKAIAREIKHQDTLKSGVGTQQ